VAYAYSYIVLLPITGLNVSNSLHVYIYKLSSHYVINMSIYVTKDVVI